MVVGIFKCESTRNNIAKNKFKLEYTVRNPLFQYTMNIRKFVKKGRNNSIPEDKERN